MTGRRPLLVGLAAILALGCFYVAGCGGSDETTSTTVEITTTTVEATTTTVEVTTTTVDSAVVLMQDALAVVEADMVSLTGSVTSGQATAADLKEALEVTAPHWQAVVDACAGVGADPEEAQQLWEDLADAVNALPDNAGLMQMATVAAPAGAIQNYMAQLHAQVGQAPAAVATTDSTTE